MHHGFTVRTLCRVDPLYIAVMVTVTGAPTAVVVTVKFGEVVPVATVTDAGTAATAGLSLMSVTTAPAAAAADSQRHPIPGRREPALHGCG